MDVFGYSLILQSIGYVFRKDTGDWTLTGCGKKGVHLKAIVIAA